MHVPEADLPRYRALKAIADQFDTLGNSLSNIGDYPLANSMWRKRASFMARAQELRVPSHTAPHLDENPQLPHVDS